MSSYVYMDAHQLRDLCNKVIERVDACRENDVKTYVTEVTVRWNGRRQWFGKKKIWTPDEVRKAMEASHDIWDMESWHLHSISVRWGATRDTAVRLLATTHYSHNVHVSSLDLDYLHPWVK